MKVEVSDQVVAFVRGLAPEPRRRLRSALRDLGEGRGDVQPLEGPLAGFYRLRAGRYRIVFHYASMGRSRTVRCEFAEERSLVYQVFAELVRHLQFPAS